MYVMFILTGGVGLTPVIVSIALFPLIVYAALINLTNY